MRYSLFDNQIDADSFAAEVQIECDKNHMPDTPRIVKYAVYIGHLGKWVVSREYDPPVIRGEDVDDIEPPPVEEGEPL